MTPTGAEVTTAQKQGPIDRFIDPGGSGGPALLDGLWAQACDETKREAAAAYTTMDDAGAGAGAGAAPGGPAASQI